MTTLGFLAFAAWCAALSAMDIRFRRLPNLLTVPGAGAVLGHAALTGHFHSAAWGAALLATPYLLIHSARPAALGAGDVKLAVGLGAAAGLGGGPVWVWSAVAAPVCTAFAGAGALLGSRAGRRIFGGPHRIGARWALAPERTEPTIAHGASMCAVTLLGLTLW
ncbi:prepilin peptidase [Nocardia sienata]|uniref:prepilin peptidase n=1 Tax=Nocardia sienata TaxID=248552 RepID=UPI0007A3C230|nr:A24 family peptidase [Nocardia sienata]